ncbi:MAG TPA: coenzyme F420-0:L-glutamate ligase [Clostridia bacterium]|jgi:F420-0:gamma-glutamyl ligase|nr:coenzyme F420-0:L-glutamate ligase [Clostridia bacterium]
MSLLGTISRGIKAPIFRNGDNLIKMVPDCVINAASQSGFEIRDNDVIGITEAIVARTQGNYATVEQITKDVSNKLGDKEVGLIFPILSRNRFALLLKGIARGVKKLYIVLTYPQDEVGNPLISPSLIDEKGVNPFSDTFTEAEFRAKFGKIEHPFTGVDYIKLYKEIAGENCEIILSNRIETILDYTPYVINADIHTRKRTKRILLEKGAKIVIGLEDILTESVDGSGYNEKYGLLGSNLATEHSVKLFPRGGDEIVNGIKEQMLIKTGKKVEVLIYGDGAFKDPVGGIWELADPVVSPSYTSGLEGRPSEVKLKYIADNMLTKDCAEEELKKIIKENKAHHDDNLALGTTPRRLTDLLGSLCDLTSGSGDKGTPIILIQGYFDDYSTERD